MKLFLIFTISIALVGAYRWWDSSSVEIVLPSTKQLNEMVGRDEAPKVPLPNRSSGN